MYVCGITPYDATHLGHAATYLTFDLICRYLRASGATVKYVQNITDIDDPLLERANRDGIDWQALARSQIELFRTDMVALHILPPDHFIGVVDAIPLIIECIERLQSKGSVYSLERDLYFSIDSFNEFGKLSQLNPETMEELFAQRGGDPARVGKKNPLDPLLWLSQRAGEPSWPSPFGEGRPGWHIECSAIALGYLELDESEPASIDIQGGGSDLIFPHHEMSAAQAEILQSKPLAKFYVHGGMVCLDGEKMSKSKGNLVLVSTLLQDGYDPMAIRLALLSEKYNKDRMWDHGQLMRAQSQLDFIRLALSMMEVAPTFEVLQEITNAISDDLDTPKAIGLLLDWARQTVAGAVGGHPGELARGVDTLLGIAF